MRDNLKGRRKPAIVVSQSDYERLDRLASAATGRMPEASDELFAELERARIVPDAKLPYDVVRMGSLLEFKPDTGASRVVTLVFPDEADIADGKVSILTPIGTALLGLRPRQSITWLARDGRQHDLTVLSVQQSPTKSHLNMRSMLEAGA
jgi:regulator of nucleoside diphosphate kinase